MYRVVRVKRTSRKTTPPSIQLGKCGMLPVERREVLNKGQREWKGTDTIVEMRCAVVGNMGILCGRQLTLLHLLSHTVN